MEMFEIVGKSLKHFGYPYYLLLVAYTITIGLYYYYRPIFVNSSHNYMKMIHLRYCLFWSLNCMYDERTEILLSCWAYECVFLQLEI